MTTRSTRPRRCSYVIAVDDGATNAELRQLALYLSGLASADCEVLIFDNAADAHVDDHRRILRWVGRYCAVGSHYRDRAGKVDVLRASVDSAAAEKVIIATASTRYTAAEISRICDLLDQHDVVEPEEFIDPLPWWGGIDAGRILLLRGVDQLGSGSSTFGFIKRAFRSHHSFEDTHSDSDLRHLMLQWTDRHEARDLFVRREPPQFRRWLSDRGHAAQEDFSAPMKAAFFLALLPLVILLAIIGGPDFAGGYAGVIAGASIMLALRGRIGAARFFPLHTCLYAPLWIAERSVGIYWALLRRIAPGDAESGSTSIRSRAHETPDRSSHSRS